MQNDRIVILVSKVNMPQKLSLSSFESLGLGQLLYQLGFSEENVEKLATDIQTGTNSLFISLVLQRIPTDAQTKIKNSLLLAEPPQSDTLSLLLRTGYESKPQEHSFETLADAAYMTTALGFFKELYTRLPKEKRPLLDAKMSELSSAVMLHLQQEG